MATVPTYTDGTTPHSADLAWYQTTPRVRVYNSTGPSLTTATNTLLTWDSEEVNNDTMHSTVTNTSRLVATTAGRYLVSAMVNFSGNTTGIRSLAIRKNAAGSFSGGTALPQPIGAGSSTATMVDCTFTTFLNATDYLEVWAYQNAGGALSLIAGPWNTCFEMVWIGTV